MSDNDQKRIASVLEDIRALVYVIVLALGVIAGTIIYAAHA